MLSRHATKRLNGVICSEGLCRPDYRPSFIVLQSTIHTGYFGLISPQRRPRNASPIPFIIPIKRFLSIDEKSDREYINARYTTISITQPQHPELGGSPRPEALVGNLRAKVTHKVSKVQLCRENGIQPRDLRSLDTDMVLAQSRYKCTHFLTGYPAARPSCICTCQVTVYIVLYTQYTRCYQG